MKAFGYVRVSGEGQIDGDGFTRQEKAIRDYAEKNGLTIEKIFREEGVSGTKENRAALAEMMVSLEMNHHGVKTVVIEKLDLLARDLLVQEGIIRDLKSKGFDLISVAEGPDLMSDDPSRKLIRQMFGAISEYDKSMLVLKLRVARDRIRARDGKCEGRKGYEEVAPEIIREIKRLRRPYGSRKPMTFKAIADHLNETGVKTRTGTPWTPANVQMTIRK
jgi:DNA invertase Pin-like site-specific DNA recombinase